MAGTGNLPPGFDRHLSCIVDEREWVFSGTRFVSPIGSDAQNILLFESISVANSFAEALKDRGVSAGIHSRRANYALLKASIFGPIVGDPVPAPKKRKGPPKPRHQPALTLSAARAEKAAMQ